MAGTWASIFPLLAFKITILSTFGLRLRRAGAFRDLLEHTERRPGVEEHRRGHQELYRHTAARKLLEIPRDRPDLIHILGGFSPFRRPLKPPK